MIRKRNNVEINSKIGKLTVLSFTEKISGFNKYIDTLCHCDCGNQCEVRKQLLVTDRQKSCGCNKDIGINNIEKIIGNVYGKLTAIGIDVGEKGRKLVLTKCSCGNKKILKNRITHLLNGKVKSCGCGIAKVNYNYSFFESYSRERDYIVGLIATDGCMNKNGSTVSIVLQKGDKSILDKISKLLCGEIICKKVKLKNNDNFEHYSLRIHGKKIYEDLELLGLYKRKTTTYTVPDKFKYSKHFWRGCIDGDGTIQTYNKNNFYFTIGVCGTNSVCQGFKDYINYCGYKNDNIVKIPNNNICSFDFSTYTFNGKHALKFCKYFYEDKGDLFIERKYNKFLKGIDNYENSKKYDSNYLN